MAVHSAAVRRSRRWLTVALTAALAVGPGTFPTPALAGNAHLPRPGDRQLTVGGPGVLLDLTGPATLGFQASAGQRLTVLAQRRTLTADDNTDLTIVRDGATVAEGTLIVTWASASVDFTAPAAGAYTVRISPRAAKERGTLLVSLVGASSGTLALRGPSRTVTIAKAGERAILTFPATAGQRLTLVARRGTLPKDEYTNLDIHNPSGELNTSGAVGYDSDYRTLDFDVTETGRHTVEVNPDTDGTGTLTVQLTGSVTAVLTPGKPARITFTQPGERAFVTFRAAESEQFRLTAHPGTLTTAENIQLKVRTPAGLDVVDATLTTAEPTATLSFSSSAGTYTIEIDPEGLDTGTLTLDLSRLP
ncbi:hypothetical protein Aph02nite_57530 [Actinoplanes philippinensis]|uniref:Pre-peptidase C-terminal domain-containing protein n=1 Tax=Actinoplanes philippinensis TaxID=35752 RepID=A0A1I2IXS0_9ACTN|nr:hypothetical protein [Actinoplanes philippinensis]GIE79803.1 hypothetical protein Aph02nite_57530 [Actinoplanes philippinensis]SFF47302.1 hypothetical protein SAMN05421541_11149 [Actinoplanes philippinensis]